MKNYEVLEIISKCIMLAFLLASLASIPWFYDTVVVSGNPATEKNIRKASMDSCVKKELESYLSVNMVIKNRTIKYVKKGCAEKIHLINQRKAFKN